MTKEEKRATLVEALRNIPGNMRTALEERKKGSNEIERPDFIWHFMLQSLSTQGNSRGSAGIIKDQQNYSRITFDALSKLDAEERISVLREVMWLAKVRMPDKKAEWAATNFDIVVRMGGVEKAKHLALEQKGKDAKIKFIKQFAGIGDKYARNFWMDVYHPEFRDCVAIDDRIKKITKAMGYSFDSYKEHEGFYLEIASQAGLEGWELDRLLYNNRDYFLAGLGIHTDSRPASRSGCR